MPRELTRLYAFGSRLPAGYPALSFWLPTPGVKNRSSGGVRRLGFQPPQYCIL